MNIRMIGKYIGYLLLAEAVFLLPAALVSLIYGEIIALQALLITVFICAAGGAALFFAFRSLNMPIYAREGFVVAGAGWFVISLLGALPFWISGEIPHYIDAVFETVSGFTTTGASILTDVEAMSKGLLFWRSFTHWLGGIGILVFILAFVRGRAGSGFTLHLLRAESPGPQVGKVMPKMRESVRALYIVYIGLSLINLAFLLVGRMPLFDALCTMFGTAGTGGFGIKADSMGSYSPYLQTVCTVFMALFGVNFSLYHLLLRKEWKPVLKDNDLHLYTGILLGSTAIVTAALLVYGVFQNFGQSLHHSAFAVSSVMTTTGFATVDFNLWPEVCRSLLLILMIVGAMAGSTGGGLKTIRVLILIKGIKAAIYRITHPRSVKAVKVNGKTIDESVVRSIFTFLAVYLCIVLVSFLLISVDNLSMETSLSAVLSCFNNIGPGLGLVGPASNYATFSYFSKVILTLNMLLGRLEIFPILLLFIPSTWRRKA